VVNQYQMIKADPSRSGFAAAFTSPMLITGGAKVYTTFTSKQVFNGEIIIRFSTDGKFLIIGKLNFADGALSITGRLYADLSKIAQGEATVLFLADIPDQVQLLTIDGRLKMGFRDPNGQEVAFTVVDPQTGKPYAKVAGPSSGGAIGLGTWNNRGYVDVAVPGGPSGAVLNLATLTDLAAEFKIVGNAVRLDSTQAPVLVSGNTFRYWLSGDPDSTATSVDIVWLKETWSYTSATGEEVFHETLGAYQDANDVWLNETTQSFTFLLVPYVDMKLVASSGAQIDDARLQSIATQGAIALRRGTTPIPSTSAMALGNGTIRYFFDGVEMVEGVYTVESAAGVWQDSSGATNDAKTYSFQVVLPRAEVGAPFSAPLPTDPTIRYVDVNVANALAGSPYIDVTFTPTPGAALDYASIFDPEQEFSISAGITVSGTPTAIALQVDADGLAQIVFITKPGGMSDADFYTQLARDGITQFRYTVTSGAFAPANIDISFLANDDLGQGWRDSAGNEGVADTQPRKFVIEGATATLVAPAPNGQVDFGELNGRNYLDITFDATFLSGFSLPSG
jgi:hypothetical protein